MEKKSASLLSSASYYYELSTKFNITHQIQNSSSKKKLTLADFSDKNLSCINNHKIKHV